MCGIVGMTRPGECAPEVFSRMVDRLARRGPDARGEYRNDLVALGHRRLNILDLSDRGAQPMLSDDKSVVIVYNGECYNHLELRALLPAAPWKSTCDTETLLRLYERFGPSFISRVNGMFAIAILDVRRRKLLLFRDRLGKKPLYYFDDGERFLFASDLAALHPHPRFSRRINELAVCHYFLYNYIPGTEAIFEGVHKLRPGSWLAYDLTTRRITRHQYWSALDAIAGGVSARRATPGNALEEFDSLLLDSVRLRTLSDVPLGCFLSGGVDSSAIAAALTKVSPGRVKTFTIGFREREYDESEHARRVASHLGTEHHEMTVTARDSLELIPHLGAVSGEPFADPSILPTLLLSKLTREHVTVALSGDAGDELFLGYDRYLLAKKVERIARWMPDTARRLAAAIAAHVPNYRLRMIAEGMRFPDRDQLYPYVFIGWNHRFVQKLLVPSARHRFEFRSDFIHRLMEESRRLPLEARAGYADLQHYLVDDIMVKVDRASMHYSLEARAPLMDHRLVEFALRLPTSLRMSGTRQKILLRRWLYGHVPEALFERPKAGFAVPLRHWFREELRDLTHDLLSPREMNRHGLFDTAFVATLLRDHQSGRWNFERQLWALLCFQLWHREWMS